MSILMRGQTFFFPLGVNPASHESWTCAQPGCSSHHFPTCYAAYGLTPSPLPPCMPKMTLQLLVSSSVKPCKNPNGAAAREAGKLLASVLSKFYWASAINLTEPRVTRENLIEGITSIGLAEACVWYMTSCLLIDLGRSSSLWALSPQGRGYWVV